MELYKYCVHLLFAENELELDGLNTTDVLSYSPIGQQSHMYVMGLNLRSQEVCYSAGSRRI